MPTRPPTHGRDLRRQLDASRGTATQRGYDYRWTKYRKCFLEEHPLCVRCLKAGRITAATVADHIIPHKGNRQLFWDEKNHQALCASCHSHKTATEDGGFGRTNART